MTARVVAVTGTGTDVGKTHFGEALLRALVLKGARAVGLKPIETGVSPFHESDASRLATASTLHVKRALFQFPAPVSPHLAAREAATPIDPTAVIAFVDTFRASADVVVVELAGGLFTPLADDYSNADLLRELSPNTTVLVAPDRLGVLHDVTAAFRAAATVPAAIHLAVLLSPANTDASTGRNAAELFRILRLPTHSLPRGPTADLAVHSEMADVLARIAHGP